FTPETRAAGAALAAHGTNLLNNPNSAITQTPGSGVGGTSFLGTPALSPEPTASFWEKAAGAGGIASGLAGALAKLGAGSGSGGGSVGDALKKLFGGGGSSVGGNPTVTGNYDPTEYAGINPETGEPIQPGATQGASVPEDYGRDPNQFDPYLPGELEQYGE
ncbi:MAG TPA: hypothetical protein VGG59_06225, partial [Acidobacteriaceae bacterium]